MGSAAHEYLKFDYEHHGLPAPKRSSLESIVSKERVSLIAATKSGNHGSSSAAFYFG
jgi:hypothetical protein